MFSITSEIYRENHETIYDLEAKNVFLRDALDVLFNTRTTQVGGVIGIEADSYPVDSSIRFITVSNGMEHLTGAYENRTLHFPANMSGASKLRVFRAIHARHRGEV